MTKYAPVSVHDCNDPDFIDCKTRAHRKCSACSIPTSFYKIEVDEGSLRRVRVYLCWDCERRQNRGQSTLKERQSAARQEELRAARTRMDWMLATDPIDDSHLDVGSLPEQIPSTVRRALRAFYASDETTAVVFDMSPTTLNQSITTLGLANCMYAEQRSGHTVVRKVGATS